MPVLMDLEWIETADGRPSLTQLAAMRVSAAWQDQGQNQGLEQFTAVLCPSGLETCDPTHMALNGYHWKEFQHGEDEASAMVRLAAWLREDDMIYLWHRSSKDALMLAWRDAFQTELPYKVACVRNRIGAALRRNGIASDNLYSIADALGLRADAPMHCAKSDIALMRRVLQKLHVSLKAPTTQPMIHKKVIPREERNRDIIARTQYHYLFTPESNVFHTRDCSRMRNALNILGSVYYDTAAKGRRPCKICKPVEGDSSQERTQPGKKEKTRDVDYGEIITVRVLGGGAIQVGRGKLVGYCRNVIHPGWLTKGLMNQHDCLGKECFYFQKNENAPY